MKNLVRGKENRTEVLNGLNLKSETVIMKYVLINGVPHKVNTKGELVPLTFKERRVKPDDINKIVSKEIKISEQLITQDSHEQLPLAS